MKKYVGGFIVPIAFILGMALMCIVKEKSEVSLLKQTVHDTIYVYDTVCYFKTGESNGFYFLKPKNDSVYDTIFLKNITISLDKK